MAQPHRNRLRIDIHPAGDEGDPDGIHLARADAAVLALARLIGRQMAREQFQRQLARERKPAKRRDSQQEGEEHIPFGRRRM